MEGVPPPSDGEGNEKFQLFEETMKKLGSKLKEGNALEIGQRGSNKVSAIEEQLLHRLEKPEQSVPKQPAVSVSFISVINLFLLVIKCGRVYIFKHI